MMNGVLAEHVARGDLLLLRGITNRWAVTWERDTGDGFQPVDLTGYECLYSMRLEDGTEVYRQYCTARSDGIAAVYIPPAAFADGIWRQRTAGTWRITATKGLVTELLGQGYWHLDD